MKRGFIALGMAFLLTACKHPLEIIGEGDILSASGNRTCLLEEFESGASNCAENEVSGDYLETYYAVARPGWYFHHWQYYCVNDKTGECAFNVGAGIIDLFAGATASPLRAIFRPNVNTGLNAFFMGHSLFIPMAEGLAAHPASLGFVDHSQNFQFGPGPAGSAEALWNDPVTRSAIQAVLNTGNIQLLGMAYHPDYPSITGFQKWMQYAIQKNPDTRFFIGLPWQWYPDTTTAANYDANWQAYHPATVHNLIDQLRTKFPGSDIYCIPHGEAAVELYNQYAAGQLSDDVDRLVGAEPTVFTDSRGHPGQLLVDTAELVWLGAIYGVDLNSYLGYVPPYSVDIKAIAQAVLDGHASTYNNPYP